jgi:hypothetical protein
MMTVSVRTVPGQETKDPAGVILRGVSGGEQSDLLPHPSLEKSSSRENQGKVS